MIKRKVLVDGELIDNLISELKDEIEELQGTIAQAERSFQALDDIMLEIKRALKPKKQVIHAKEKDK